MMFMISVLKLRNNIFIINKKCGAAYKKYPMYKCNTSVGK